jgi:hypothetical protein
MFAVAVFFCLQTEFWHPSLLDSHCLCLCSLTSLDMATKHLGLTKMEHARTVISLPLWQGKGLHCFTLPACFLVSFYG